MDHFSLSKIAAGASIVSSLLGCSGNSGNTPVPAPNKNGTECSPTVAGWQHACYGDISFYTGEPEIKTLILRLNDVSTYPDSACCEGSATQAVADAACQTGCYDKACALFFGELNLQITPLAYQLCTTGTFFEACTKNLSPTCADYQVACDDIISNEIFDTDGALASLDNKPLCGAAIAHGDDGNSETGSETNAETSGFTMSTWSPYHLELEPTETSMSVDWSSTTWGSGSSSGSSGGFADYRIDTCPARGGDCIHLRHLVIYGGDIEINGIEVSNMITQLTSPAWLPLDEYSNVEISAGDFRMLTTYTISGARVAWETSNTNTTDGVIDPRADEFVLWALEFVALEGDIRVAVELDIGGSHL